MARGDNVTIPSNTGALRKANNPTVNSILVLNPNNGIVYVGINGAASPIVWDWVVPSQSRAYLPGPWLEYGLYYVDQSGAGASGNVTIYETDRRLDVPDYAAIGIARLAQQTNLDITEGIKPANPGVGIARIWADISDFLHILNSGGVDTTVIDTLTALSGALIGTLPNPQIDSTLFARIRGGNSQPVAGEGLDLSYDIVGHSANLVSYDHTALIYRVMQLIASSMYISAQAGGISISATGGVDFLGVGTTVDFKTAGLNPTLGTWTPALSQGVALTLGSALGRHIKIGKFVFCIYSCAIGSAGTAANILQLTGMPYVSSDLTGSFICDGVAIYLDSGSALYTPVSYHTNTTTLAYLTNGLAGNFGQTPAITAASGDSLQGFLMYEA